MELKLLVLQSIVLFADSVTGGSRAVCPTQPIKVVEGENVALHCGLDPLFNLSRYTVDWTRVDNQQVVYRHGRDHLEPVVDQYRGRTTINHEGLSRGNMTLKISSANLSDSGLFKCFVPELEAWCEVRLIVEEKETKTVVSSTTGPPLVEEPESEDHGAAMWAAVLHVVFAVWKTVLHIVDVFAAAANRLSILWKVFKIFKKTFRGKKKKMSTGPTEGDEDPHSAAEALTEVVVHDENHSSGKNIQQV